MRKINKIIKNLTRNNIRDRYVFFTKKWFALCVCVFFVPGCSHKKYAYLLGTQNFYYL